MSGAAFLIHKPLKKKLNLSSRYGAEVVKHLPTVLTHGEFTKHVDVIPAPAQALKSPVTEIILAYFPPDISLDEKAQVSLRFQQFAEKGLHKCTEITSISHGWGVQNDFPVIEAEDGQTGSLFIAFVGWPSIDARMKFQETDAFKQHVEFITKMEGTLKTVTIHVNCRSSEREG